MTSGIFSVQTVLTMTDFCDSRVAIALGKRIDDEKRFDTFLNNVILFQKETLQEHTKDLFYFFVGLCVYKKITDQFFE